MILILFLFNLKFNYNLRIGKNLKTKKKVAKGLENIRIRKNMAFNLLLGFLRNINSIYLRSIFIHVNMSREIYCESSFKKIICMQI